MNENNERKKDFLKCLGNGKSLIEIESEEEDGVEVINTLIA